MNTMQSWAGYMHGRLRLSVCVSALLALCLCGGGQAQENWPWFTQEEMECPQMADDMLPVPLAPWGAAGRAWMTIPPQIEVRNSTIPGAGLGTYATTFLKAYTWLGEYDGEIFNTYAYNMVTDYAWQLYRNDSMDYYVDGAKIETSNWLRWVNCPRTAAEENVKGMYCYGKILYMTTKPVHPGQELFVYYGHDYAYRLGINVTEFEGDMENLEDYYTSLSKEEGEGEVGDEDGEGSLYDKYMNEFSDDSAPWKSFGNSPLMWQTIDLTKSNLYQRKVPGYGPAKDCKCTCTLEEGKTEDGTDTESTSNDKESSDNTNTENNQSSKDIEDTADKTGAPEIKDKSQYNECGSKIKENDSVTGAECTGSTNDGTPTVNEDSASGTESNSATKDNFGTASEIKDNFGTRLGMKDYVGTSGAECELAADDDTKTCECSCFIRNKIMNEETNTESPIGFTNNEDNSQSETSEQQGSHSNDQYDNDITIETEETIL